MRRKELQAWSYVFPSDRRVPTMINVSEYALRLSTVLAMCRTVPGRMFDLPDCLCFWMDHWFRILLGRTGIRAGRPLRQCPVRAHEAELGAEADEALRRPLIADSHAVSAFSTRRMCSWHPFCSGLPGWIRS